VAFNPEGEEKRGSITFSSLLFLKLAGIIKRGDKRNYIAFSVYVIILLYYSPSYKIAT